jgi:hypothetical protein
MDKEYKIIREGLIGLLCVGDRIRRLHRVLGSFNHKTQSHDIYYFVSLDIIKSITPGESIELVLSSGFGTRLPLRNIEVYKDELYAFSLSDISKELNHEEKMRRLIELLEDQNTSYEMPDGIRL